MYEDAIVLQRMQRFQPFQKSILIQNYGGYEPFSLEYQYIELDYCWSCVRKTETFLVTKKLVEKPNITSFAVMFNRL